MDVRRGPCIFRIFQCVIAYARLGFNSKSRTCINGSTQTEAEAMDFVDCFELCFDMSRNNACK